ncbi:hypothetical protein IEE92_01595 [Kocuria sp. cx-116]|uniref:hypothetical protein n=1 Tax=Kocuria sp. cx-116 TaxID=2771378 RepID=UPI0016823611|nr:hypothetical protein [Kocuria sp. cx-116]MBD2761261.1 hypothetical protein [Kocuria sp. cx-116]
MLHLLNNAALSAEEGGHHVVNELPIPTEMFGVIAFILFVLMLIATASYSSRGKSPEAGEYEDPAGLPANERAMIDDLNSPRQH